MVAWLGSLMTFNLTGAQACKNSSNFTARKFLHLSRIAEAGLSAEQKTFGVALHGSPIKLITPAEVKIYLFFL